MAELDVFSRKIADALRELAVERGQSQSSLAEISGVSQGQISRIFSHKRSVSVEDLALLAIALGTSASEIAARAEEAIAAGGGASLAILDGDGSGGADDEMHRPDDGLPDMSKLAARRVSLRPSWDASRAGTDAGENPQD